MNAAIIEQMFNDAITGVKFPLHLLVTRLQDPACLNCCFAKEQTTLRALDANRTATR